MKREDSNLSYIKAKYPNSQAISQAKKKKKTHKTHYRSQVV